MGMIGSSSPNNWADILTLIGAGLKDASPMSQGGNLLGAQQLLMQRNAQRQQMQLLNGLPGLFGGQAAQTAGTMAAGEGAGASPSSASAGPDWNNIARAAPIYKAMGLDLAPSIEALKAGQPHIVFAPDNSAINDKDASAQNKVFPKVGEGQVLLRDANGNPLGIMNVPGYAAAAGQTAGAVADAQQRAQAAYDLVYPKLRAGGEGPPTSRLGLLTGQALPAGVLGGAGAAAADGSQLGSPSPAELELAKARAATQGSREADMQGARAAMQQVDDQTNMIAQNLHDMLGETQDPNTGKWVKTKPSMITGGLMPSAGSATDIVEHIPFINQPAKDLQAKIETVRNGTSFNSLQAIKNALQAAGDGGSGSIRMTDQTARMLGEINGSLKQDQSPDQFEATVRRHIQQLDALNKARHDLFASQYQGVQTPIPGQTAPIPPGMKGVPARQPRTPTMAGKGYKILSVQ